MAKTTNQTTPTTTSETNGTTPLRSLDFVLPAELHASEPPEERGTLRDAVRLMVSHYGNDHVMHRQFREIDTVLQGGDLIVVNTSGTLAAALPATWTKSGKEFELHLSTRLPADLWIVEVRQMGGAWGTTLPYFDDLAGEMLELPDGGRVVLLTRYKNSPRLWVATLLLPMSLHPYLEANGYPIRYGYVKRDWPLSYYQTAFATEMGSAEMPSAGRAFTPELITRLVCKGVQVVPLILHTGVASLESHEAPYDEFYSVSAQTASQVTAARREGRRIIAVGTTVVRALETVTQGGITHAGSGWTEIMITPQRGLFSVNGLLTGMHEPEATHLMMLEALTGHQHLLVTYAHALHQRYRWHEFGDLHLILP